MEVKDVIYNTDKDCDDSFLVDFVKMFVCFSVNGVNGVALIRIEL